MGTCWKTNALYQHSLHIRDNNLQLVVHHSPSLSNAGPQLSVNSCQWKHPFRCFNAISPNMSKTVFNLFWKMKKKKSYAPKLYCHYRTYMLNLNFRFVNSTSFIPWVWQKRLKSVKGQCKVSELFNHLLALITFCNHPNAVLKLLFFFTFFPPYPEAVAELGRKEDREAFCQEHRTTRFKSVAAWLLWRTTTTKKQRRHDGLTDSLSCLFTTRLDVPQTENRIEFLKERPSCRIHHCTFW